MGRGRQQWLCQRKVKVNAVRQACAVTGLRARGLANFRRSNRERALLQILGVLCPRMGFAVMPGPGDPVGQMKLNHSFKGSTGDDRTIMP